MKTTPFEMVFIIRELVSRRGQNYQVKMFRRKQRFAPFHQKGRGIFMSSRDIPRIKFSKRK